MHCAIGFIVQRLKMNPNIEHFDFCNLAENFVPRSSGFMISDGVRLNPPLGTAEEIPFKKTSSGKKKKSSKTLRS
ncbi:hypothetical protein VNO77_22911 [Canavalia gladiata]|uniref:Uncharacterized protein n=1 Tax=Canavalia gladiata TaxID=3824 RepID=A0AAN9QBE4_CANGL